MSRGPLSAATGAVPMTCKVTRVARTAFVGLEVEITCPTRKRCGEKVAFLREGAEARGQESQ